MTSSICAVILAGGRGTRLSSVWTQPKILAPVDSETRVLEVLLETCQKSAIDKVHFALGSGAEIVISELKATKFNNKLRITWSVEPEALNTGGAVLYSAIQLSEPNLLVMNGDTIFNSPFPIRFFEHRLSRTAVIGYFDFTGVENSRYGSVCLQNQRLKITPWSETVADISRVYSGVSSISREGLKIFNFEPITMEDLLTKYCLKFGGELVRMNGSFLDIGVPASFTGACEFYKAARAKNG